MDWNASIGLVLLAAFSIGALHALEPGHGKSIMGAYLVASHGGIRHAFLLGLVVTVTHTLVVFVLAIGALMLADRFASAQITFWLEVVSGLLVLTVGVWMLLTSFGLVRRPGAGIVEAAHQHEHAHSQAGHHDHANHHDHDPHHGDHHDHNHGHSHAHSHHGHTHEVRLPAGKDPLGLWTLTAVGASGGLVPCPAALTALLAAVSLGRPVTGIAVVGAMSIGIAAMLIGIGILFVQAGRVASRWFGARLLSIHVPRLSALLITVLGVALLLRTIMGSTPAH